MIVNVLVPDSQLLTTSMICDQPQLWYNISVTKTLLLRTYPNPVDPIPDFSRSINYSDFTTFEFNNLVPVSVDLINFINYKPFFYFELPKDVCHVDGKKFIICL